MSLDLADLAAIRTFATELASRELPPLGAVICNAGVQFIQRPTYTQNGFDTTFGVNHLGHFDLVQIRVTKQKALAAGNLKTQYRILRAKNGS